jgi:uncharacterized protein with HEPN domain
VSRETRLYLEDIVTACKRIGEYTAQTAFEAFARDQMKQDAVIRNLEIIGEAAKKLPSAVTATMPQVAWREVCGFRDILAHKYFSVNLDIVWNAVTADLPVLESATSAHLKQMLAEES